MLTKKPDKITVLVQECVCFFHIPLNIVATDTSFQNLLTLPYKDSLKSHVSLHPSTTPLNDARTLPPVEEGCRGG